VLGLERPDDAAAYRTPRGEVVVLSVDLFRGFTDDPWLVGCVAAINALSDIQAKGVEPRHALALVSVPDQLESDDAEEVLFQVLAGARAVFDRLGVVLLGGHSTTAPVLQVGFSVEGIAADPEGLLALDGLRPADALILTQPLGTGVVLHADMQGLARGPWLQAAIAAMLRDNGAAARLALAAGASAATDVTGFGLAGHLGEMARRSGVSATVELAQLPALPGALELLRQGLHSTFHPENARAASGMEIPGALSGDARVELLFDPQTAGGLLVGIATERAHGLLEQLRQSGYPEAAAIGRAESAAGAVLRVRP
jgi:selenide,water dikinase